MHIQKIHCRPSFKRRHLLLPLAATLTTQVPLSVGSQSAAVKGVNTQTNAPRRSDIRIRFVDTDVAEVLQALSRRTRDNIIYAGQGKKPITISVNAGTTDEALRYITSSAGLAFRRVGNSYVVAPAAGLRQAIEPLGEQARVPVTSVTPAEAAKAVSDAFPYVTARPVGSQVLLIGSSEDLLQAQELLQEQDKSRVPDPPATEVMAVQNVNAAQAVTLLKSLYPDLKVEAIGDTTRPGGSIGFAGPRSLIARARQSLATIDLSAAAKESDRTFRIYNIRYSSSRVLRTFLQRAMPSVTVLAGPENYSPPRPSFRPLTGGTLGTASTGIGTTTTSNQGGTDTGTGVGGGSVTDTGPPSTSDSGGATTGNASTSNGRGEVNDRAKTLVLSGSVGDVEQTLQLLNQLDIAPRQVMVDVKVIDVTPQFTEQLGVQYAFAPNVLSNVPQGTQVDPTTGLQNPSNTTPFNSAIFSRLGPGVSAQISAVASRTHSKLLADPRIQVLDNDDANIFIGDTVRTQVTQSSIAGTTIQVLEFPVGIILLVRPRINADGLITMRVHPVVSTITSISANNIPQTSNREAETTVMVKDGETIVIGGLIRDELTKTMSEVPILSKLPLVGELFRFHSHNRRRSEVMVFITPHLTTTGLPLTAAEKANAAAKTIEDTRLSTPNPPGSRLPKENDLKPPKM